MTNCLTKTEVPARSIRLATTRDSRRGSALRDEGRWKYPHWLTVLRYNVMTALPGRATRSNMNSTRIIGSAAAVTMLLAACGGSSESADTAGAGNASASTEQSAGSAPATQTPLSSSEPTTDTTPSTDAATTTAPAPTTTIAPAPEPEPFDLAALPGLVAAADAAIGDPSSDPFSVVDDIIGFPLPIPVPDGSSLLHFNAILSFVSDEGTTGWNARYDAVAPGGAVDDIDIKLDNNGAGSEQLIDFFDPVLADLGLERKNSTASDPGDPGGPNSVNHVYVAVDPERVINGVPATLDPLFIWSSEDINGWAYNDERAELGGYTIDIGFDTATADPTSADAATPFPVANAVIDAFPRPAGVTLSDLSISMHSRAADSFSIDKGDSFVDLVVTWQAAPDALEDIIAFYADPAATFTEESIVMAGEDDFFNEGTIERSEPYEYDTTGVRLDLLWLQRYGALLGIDASDDGVEPVQIRLDIELNPNDAQLTLPTE